MSFSNLLFDRIRWLFLINNRNDDRLRFDKAWKQGVAKVGVEFFNRKASSLEAVEKRW